jgi:hypothetical protein
VKKFIIAIGVAALAVGLSVGAALANSEKARRMPTRASAPGQQVVRSLGDAGPALLAAAFKKAGVSYSIVNAEGDAQRSARRPTSACSTTQR